jgi:hypothetical protein
MTEFFSDRETFEATIRHMLESGVSGSFGRIHLVNVLSSPDGNAQVSSMHKALLIAENVIQRHLAPEDACVSPEAGKYMLVFPGLNDIEGSIKATAIAREIKQRLFGQASAPINVTTQILPVERLRMRPAAEALPAIDIVLDSHERHAGIQLQVIFQPVWDSSKQAIIGNRAMTRRQFQGHTLFDDAVQLAGEQDPLAHGRNDNLRKAVAAHSARSGIAIVPQVLNDHAMTDEHEITADIHHLKNNCPGGLMVELTGAVGSTSRKRLRDCIRAIMAGGASVGVRIFPEIEMARFLKDCGVSYLCINEAQAKQASFTHSALYALLSVMAHEVSDTGLGLCLWNTSSGRDVKRAAALGFSLFSGATVGASQANMVEPHEWPTDKVFL